MTVERTRRDVCHEPRPWCARARLAIGPSDTSRRHVRGALPRSGAGSHGALRRVIDAYRARSYRSSRGRLRDARPLTPAASRLHPHRLTSPSRSHRLAFPFRRAGRRQARRGDRADPRKAPRPAVLRAKRRHHRMGPVSGRRRVLHRLQSRLGRCAVRSRDARRLLSPRRSALGTRKNAHRIPYASLERSLPSDEEPPERTFSGALRQARRCARASWTRPACRARWMKWPRSTVRALALADPAAVSRG